MPLGTGFGTWVSMLAFMALGRLLKRGNMMGPKATPLTIDATGIVAKKQSAKMTYKGFKGYMPIVGHIADNGLVLGDEFRERNVAPATRNIDFIKYCKCPKERRSPF
jgi:hypothetical protein